jgi:hypothetical protein
MDNVSHVNYGSRRTNTPTLQHSNTSKGVAIHNPEPSAVRVPGAGSIRQAAGQRKKEKFTALLHHISPEHLEAAFFELKENAAPGVDGLTWRAYEEGLDTNILDLHSRLHKGAYRALPSRRVYIPKPDGRQRPLAEEDFLGACPMRIINAG